VVETIAIVVVALGLIAMVATPIWALHKRQQWLELRARQESAGVAPARLTPADRASARFHQRRTYHVRFWGWLCVPVFLLIGPIAMESSEALGLLITIAALIAFVVSVESSPVDESLAAALKEPEAEQQDGDRRKGLARLPWFAKLNLIVGAVLLPAGGVLLLTGQTTLGLIAAALWVIDTAVVLPVISSALAKRERQAQQASA
jgi:Ca2+/Na+ antiporter